MIIRKHLFRCAYSASAIEVDNTTYEYSLDGIDDYSMFETAVPVFEGDIVRFYAMRGISVTAEMLIYSDVNVQKGRVFESSNGHNLVCTNYINLKLDGVGIPVATTPIPDDGKYHLIEVIATANSEVIKFIGTNPALGSYKSNGIKDLTIIRKYPTVEHPNLYWPMNEGASSTTGYERLTSDSKYAMTYFNFNDENWSEQKYYEYALDSIDDYAVADETIDLYEGDVLTVRTTVEDSSYYRYVLAGPSGGLWASGGEVIGLSEEWGSLVELYINGTQYASGAYTAILGEELEITLVFTGSSTMTHIGVSALVPSERWKGKISDIRLVRATPSSTNRDLYWPMNEGPGATIGREVLVDDGTTDLTYFNFNDENWAGLDETTETEWTINDVNLISNALEVHTK